MLTKQLKENNKASVRLNYTVTETDLNEILYNLVNGYSSYDWENAAYIPMDNVIGIYRS